MDLNIKLTAPYYARGGNAEACVTDGWMALVLYLTRDVIEMRVIRAL